MAQLDGTNLAMQTPGNDDGSIDCARWEAPIDIYIDAGVQALLAAGEHAAARQLWSRIIPSLLYIWSDQYIAKVKAACRLRSFDAGCVRAPLRKLDADDVGELAQPLEPLNQE